MGVAGRVAHLGGRRPQGVELTLQLRVACLQEGGVDERRQSMKVWKLGWLMH
jgi:hypothetical protein